MRSAAEAEGLPSVVVGGLLAALILVPEPYGTIAEVLLLALVGVGTLSLIERLERWIASRVIRAVVAVGITAFFLAHLLAPNGSHLLAAVTGLPLAWLGADHLRGWTGPRVRRGKGGRAMIEGDGDPPAATLGGHGRGRRAPSSPAPARRGSARPAPWHPRQRSSSPGAPRPSEGPRTRVPPVSGPKRVCHEHKDKRIFATRAEAQDFVDWSRRKAAAGHWEGAPMDRCYKCPLVGVDHYHVTSTPPATGRP